MPPIATPDIKPLPRVHRHLIFVAAITVFIIAVPSLVFYATGYRLNFFDEESNITSVGGMYVTSDLREVDMYLDDEIINDMRAFQNATYIQNLQSGVHQIHVQGEGVQTWVKELPVYSHIVTEAQSFNMPTVPQIRLITQWISPESASVLFKDATSTQFAFASTTNSFFLSTTSATTTFSSNSEYEYVLSLFASSTEEELLLKAQKEALQKERFAFSTTKPPLATSTATSTKVWRDIELSESEGEVYAQWVGEPQGIPYYFCVKHENASTTNGSYGAHVYDSLIAEYGTTSKFNNALQVTDRLCRTKIRIDRLWQTVQWFDFYPDNRDHVLMLLEDGLYVVEIDDRSWQNAQLLYPGKNLKVLLDGGRIYINDGEYYLEVFTRIQ